MSRVNYLVPNDFDITKFNIPTEFRNNVMFPKYKYDNEEDTLMIVTSEIVMYYGGIPQINDLLRPTDESCSYINIPFGCTGNSSPDDRPIEILNEGGRELCTVISAIDKLTQDMTDNPNFLVRHNDGTKQYVLSGCTYTQCEHENKYLSAQLDIESKWDNVLHKIDDTKPTVIKTRVITLDNDGIPTFQKIKTLDDLRKFVRYGTKIIFQLELRKTSLDTTLDVPCHTLKHSFVITQMLIKK